MRERNEMERKERREWRSSSLGPTRKTTQF
jgi:hypothetical protein